MQILETDLQALLDDASNSKGEDIGNLKNLLSDAFEQKIRLSPEENEGVRVYRADTTKTSIL